MQYKTDIYVEPVGIKESCLNSLSNIYCSANTCTTTTPHTTKTLY